mgnify:CR=1 FL=1
MNEINNIIKIIATDFETLKDDLLQNKITLEQHDARLENLRLISWIENLLHLPAEVALINLQKKNDDTLKIPDEYRQKLVSAFKSNISLFYNDDLTLMVNLIPKDLPLKDTCERIGKCYDELFIKYERLKALGFIFETHYKTVFISNSKDVIATLKNLSTELESVQIQKIKSLSLDPVIVDVLSNKFSTNVSQYFKTKPVQYLYTKIRTFPDGFTELEMDYRKRVASNEFVASSPIPIVDPDIVPYVTCSQTKNIADELNVENMDLKNTNEPQTKLSIALAQYLDESIDQSKTTIENMIPEIEQNHIKVIKLEEFNHLLDRLTIKYNDLLDDAILKFTEILNNKIHFVAEDTNKIINKLTALESNTNTTNSPDLVNDNLEISKAELLDIIREIHVTLEGFNKNPENDNKILDAISKVSLMNNNFADTFSDIFKKHAADLQNSASSLISEQLEKLSPEMISQQILKLSELSSQSLILKIGTLEKNIGAIINEIGSKLKEISESTTNLLSTNETTIKTNLEKTQSSIAGSIKEFADKLDLFKVFLNDDVITKLGSIISHSNDLSRHLKITQSLLEKNKPTGNPFLMIFLVLNLVFTLAILFYSVTNSSGGSKKDAIELNRILVNINKLDANNKASVAKVLDIPMKDITNAENK